jgi:tRNA-specific 2-thiouridylase
MRVVVAMSGGVDSSVAAALLLEAGYEVIGVTMRQLAGDLPYGIELEGECCSLEAVDDARAVANKLGIPYYVLNSHVPFRGTVIDYFVDEYLRGRTPNPCVVCNRIFRFDLLLEKVAALESDFLATGHYVRRSFDETTGRWVIKKGLDASKDQSYVLFGLNQRQLARSLFPLGDYSKADIREKAKALGLRVAAKPDSQEICFIPDQDYGRFIREYRPEAVRPGNIVDESGKVLGQHRGIIDYTIGQRKGMGIAARHPLFVKEIRPASHEVVVGNAESVFSNTLVASNLNWIALAGLDHGMEVEAKIRYAAKPAAALLKPLAGNQAEVFFEVPQRAITPGQAVVFYQGDVVLGGGTIESTSTISRA